jgi:hypothetical protein
MRNVRDRERADSIATKTACQSSQRRRRRERRRKAAGGLAARRRKRRRREAERWRYDRVTSRV